MEPRATTAHHENGDESGMSGTIEYPEAMGRPWAAARRLTAADINAEQDRTTLYAAALEDLQTTTDPFAMITPTGFLRDEGSLGTARFIGRKISRPAYLRTLAWLMPGVRRVMPYLGYVVVGSARM